MLVFSKILSLLIHPLSLCLLLLLLALLLRLVGATAKANLLNVLATAWLYFCATAFGADMLSTPLEMAYPAFADEELPNADAIVVLGVESPVNLASALEVISIKRRTGCGALPICIAPVEHPLLFCQVAQPLRTACRKPG